MRTIWKYPAAPPAAELFATTWTLDIPKGSIIRHLNTQWEQPQMWVEVDPERETETRRFKLVGTGHAEIEEGAVYVGTFMVNADLEDFVFHVYEVPNVQ
jgi:hypothetical protein